MSDMSEQDRLAALTEYAVYVDRYSEDHLVRLVGGYASWYHGRQQRWRIALLDDAGGQIGHIRYVQGSALSRRMTLAEARAFIAERKAERDHDH